MKRRWQGHPLACTCVECERKRLGEKSAGRPKPKLSKSSPLDVLFPELSDRTEEMLSKLPDEPEKPKRRRFFGL